MTTPIVAQDQMYDTCILENLSKAQSEKAIELLKQTCLSKAHMKDCDTKSPKEMTDEELLACMSSPTKAGQTKKLESIKSDLQKAIEDNSSSKDVKEFSEELLIRHYNTKKIGRFWVEEEK